MSKVTKGKTRLHSLEAAEVSLVPKGANKRRFLITKSAADEDEMADVNKNVLTDIIRSGSKDPPPKRTSVGGVRGNKDNSSDVDKSGEGEEDMGDDGDADDVEKKIAKADPKMMGKVSQCLKDFKAIPVKKDDGTEEEGMGLDDDCQTAVRAAVRLLSSVKDKVSPQLMHQVLDIAGYGMPEKKQEKQADFKSVPAKVESQENDVLKTGGEPKSKLEGETVSKADNADVLSGLTPEAREKVEAVFKSNVELVAKTAQLEKDAKDRDAKDRKREIVAKAATFKNLAVPAEEIVQNLESADKAGTFDLVCKTFETLDKQAAASSLFSEVGYTAQGGNDAANAMAKLEKMAEGLVQKNADLTSEQAFTKVLETKEGKALYAEHQKARGGI